MSGRRLSPVVWTLLAILALAATLRVVGLFYGLPYSYYFDEEHLVRRAVAMGSGDLNPHWFHKPALLFYLLFAEYGAYFVIGRIAGAFASVQDFAIHYMLDTGAFYAIGRVTVCLLGLATLVAVYETGRRLYGRTAGLVASAVLAVTQGHIALCQVIKEDVPAAFFGALALLALARFLEQGKTRDLAWAGLFTGLGTATKYYPLVLATPIALAPWLRARARGERGGLDRSWIGPAVAVAAFFVGSPFNFLDSTWVRETWRVRILPILGKSSHVADDATYAGQGLLASARDFVAAILAPDAMGLILGTAALVAIVFLLLRRRPPDVVLLLALLPFAALAIVANPSATEARHLNLVFVVLALATGAGAASLSAGSRLDRSWIARGIGAGLVALALLPPALGALRRDFALDRIDARTRALDWIQANLPAGTRILSEAEHVKLVDRPENVADLLRQAKELIGDGPWTSHLVDYYRLKLEAAQRYPGPTYDLLVIHEPWWRRSEAAPGEVHYRDEEKDEAMGNPLHLRGVDPLEEYRRRGYRYLVVTENNKFKYQTEPWRSRVESFAQFYSDIDRQMVLEKEFSDEGLPYGKVVKIYRFP